MGLLEALAIADVAPGVYDVRQIPAPGAFNDAVITVPGQQVWRVIAARAVLTTDANVATRRPKLAIDDGTTTVAEISTGVTTPASTVTTYTWAAGYGAETGLAGAFVTDPWPAGMDLPGGWRITFGTRAMQVGDAWTAVTVWVYRYDIGISGIAVAREAVEQVYEHPY